MTGARDSARYEREHAEFRRLLDAGDIDAARAVVNDDAFHDVLGAAISEEVVAAVKDAKAAGLNMPAAQLHALAGHSLALHAQRWASISAQVTKARIESLEKRLAELERRQAEQEGAGVKYLGTHQRALTYRRGSIVTHGGSAWCCVAGETEEAPGTSAAWQLMVKGAR